MAAFLDSPWTGQTFSPPTPLDITTIETAIVQQLQTYLGAALGPQMIEVIHFPDKPEAYEMRHRIGAALVIYMGSEYGPILDTGHVAQERTLEFAVGLRIRDLGWAFGGPPSGTSPGAYQIVEGVRFALLGFQPNTGCTPMYAKRDRFVDRDKQGGVWVYEIVFCTRTTVVENYQVPTFPLFTRGTALEERGVTMNQIGLGAFTFATPGVGILETIQLPQTNLSGVIVKSQDLATTYSPDTDYAVDGVHSILTRLPSGKIASGATVAVSYGSSDVVTALASGGNVPFAPNN